MLGRARQHAPAGPRLEHLAHRGRAEQVVGASLVVDAAATIDEAVDALAARADIDEAGRLINAAVMAVAGVGVADDEAMRRMRLEPGEARREEGRERHRQAARPAVAAAMAARRQGRSRISNNPKIQW